MRYHSNKLTEQLKCLLGVLVLLVFFFTPASFAQMPEPCLDMEMGGPSVTAPQQNIGTMSMDVVDSTDAQKSRAPENAPCSDDADCLDMCLGFGLSSAILNDDAVLSGQTGKPVFVTPNALAPPHLIQINAPPPRN